MPPAEIPEPTSAAPTISADELVRGQKGYGLSVFVGQEPERFEVEVLGVLENSTPELSYILAKLSGQDLERSGVISGMSGSPVYFDGRLAGAVAFSYLAGLDAVAGITPIDAMRRLTELPVTTRLDSPVSATATSRIDLATLVRRDFRRENLEKRLEELGRPLRKLASASTAVAWTASGFGPEATPFLERLVGRLTPTGVAAASGGSGGGAHGVPATLGPGGSVAAVLVEGDLNMAAHGTVTDRIGDDVLAFGHPVFSLGPVNLPLAVSEVVAVVPSIFSSFKVSNVGTVVGSFYQDREAGLHGLLGPLAPMTPVEIRLRGLAERDYRMRVAELPQLRPLLVAIATLGALGSGSYAGGSQGLDLEARFALAGHDDLVIAQSFDGEGVAEASLGYLLNFASWIESNDFTEVELEGVEIELHQVDRPRSSTLEAAHAERLRVAPGERVNVHLDLRAYRGERRRRTLEVEIPESAPEGRYSLMIGDGTSMDAVRLAVERRQPETFEQALELLRRLSSRRQLEVVGLVSSRGLAVGGESLPDLPGSVRAIFGAAGSPKPVPLGLAIAHRQLFELESPIEGVVRVDLEVRRPAA